MAFENQTLYQRINDVAERQGSNTALIYYPPGQNQAQTFSYRDYIDGVNRIINWLRGMQIAEHDAVALLLPDCPLAAMLSCAVQSACIAFEIDIWTKPQQVLSVLNEVRPALIICAEDGVNPDLLEIQRVISSQFGQARIAPIDADALKNTRFDWGLPGALVQDFPADRLRLPLNTDLERTVFYRLTGGTTGRPKIAPRTAGALLSGIIDIYPLVELSPERVFLSSPFYIYFMPTGAQFLLRGMELLGGAWFDLERNLFSENRVTDINISPSYVSILTARGDFREACKNTGINLWLTGGRLLPSHYEQMQRVGVRRVFEFYGATEAGLVAFQEVRSADDVGAFAAMRAGREMKIVGDDGEPVATGVVGELLVRGGDVFNGYYGAPGNNVAAGEWFRTGDLARIDSAGRLQCMGRNFKSIRMVGSVFLDCEVLEAALTDTADLQAVGVVAAESVRGMPYVGIFVCPAQGHIAREKDIVKVFNRKMEGRADQIGVKVFILSALPMTARGKIDRPQLVKALVEDIYDSELKTAIPDVPFDLRVSEDDRQLLCIRVQRDDDLPLDESVRLRLDGFFDASPYRIVLA